MDTKRIEEIKYILDHELNIGVPGKADLGEKIGLITMICYVTQSLRKKKPSITHLDVLKTIFKDTLVDENTLIALDLICEWWSWGCLTIPNLGIKPADMPNLIKKGVQDLCPF